MPLPLTTRPLPLAVLACAIAACSPSRAPDGVAPTATPEKPVAAAKADQASAGAANAALRLTVYSGDYDALATRGGAPAVDMPGYALVDSTLEYDLKAGANTITLAHLPRALDIAAVSLRPADAGVAIQGQR
jgi:hypothetical protein